MWQAASDDQGRTYYYNTETHETSWENPEAVWKTYTTDEGKEYYYNESTGETTWEKPSALANGTETGTELQEEKDSESQDQKQDQNEIESQDLDQVSKNDQNQSSDLTDRDLQLANEPVQQSELARITPDDNAEQHFMAMLDEGQVNSTWSFERVIKTFIKKPQYWAVPDAVQRKNLFEEFLVRKIEKESSSKTELVEEFKGTFLAEIKNYVSAGKISETTRWSSVKSRLIKEDNHIFSHSILPDSELEKIYVSYMRGIADANNAALAEQKKQALTELEAYLLQITAGSDGEETTWELLHKRLQNDARFKANKHFKVLTKLDILDLYESKIYPQLVQRLTTKVDEATKENYRTDRRARDAFKKVLSSLEINANTQFKDILPSVEEEDAFIELCGRNGSTPLELLWDVVEEKRQQQRVKKDLLSSSIHSHTDYDTALASFDTFLSSLRQISDERLARFELGTESGVAEVEVIYNTLKKEREVEKQRERAVFERSLGERITALAEWMAAQDPILELVDVQEEEKQKVKTESEKKEPEQLEKMDPDKMDTDKQDTDKQVSRSKAKSVVSITGKIASVVSVAVDVDAWRRRLAQVEQFSRLDKLITNSKADQSVLQNAIERCLQQYAAALTSRLGRKRPMEKAPEKRPAKKPVLMNY